MPAFWLGLGLLVGVVACTSNTLTPQATSHVLPPSAMAHAPLELAPYRAPVAIPGTSVAPLDALVDAAAQADVVLLGEAHDRYDHHLTQLEVIKRLHERGEKVMIGMEYFHRPFQGVLDD
ncbi:MAG: ChaN family lipoprotein, partial [Gammaproteobacteria bacterium]